MNFSARVTFNTHDTKVGVVEGSNRIDIIRHPRGVKLRCELIVNTLIRMAEKMTACEIKDYLNHRFRATGCNYNIHDIRHALRRLVNAGVIRVISGEAGEENLYYSTKNTYEAWRLAKYNK